MMNLNAFGTGFGNVGNGTTSSIATAERDAANASAPGSAGSSGGDAVLRAANELTSRTAYSQAVAVASLLPAFFNLPHITSFQDGIDQLNLMETEGIALAGRLAARHASGRMQDDEYVAYEKYRKSYHQTQVAWVQNLRRELTATAGQRIAEQVMSRIGWPGWLPVISKGSAPASVQGLGLAPVAIAGIIVAALALVGIILYFGSKWTDTLQQMYLTRGQTRAIEGMVEAREQVFTQCVASGGTAESCAAVADQTIPVDAIRNFLNQAQPDGMGVFGWIGVAVVTSALVYGGWKLYQNSKASSGGVSGVRRRRGKRGIGAPVRLKSLKSEYPSRYMLEV